ncbi:hypothetical protein ESCO107199_22980 [Escherichia coli]
MNKKMHAVAVSELYRLVGGLGISYLDISESHRLPLPVMVQNVSN